MNVAGSYRPAVEAVTPGFQSGETPLDVSPEPRPPLKRLRRALNVHPHDRAAPAVRGAANR